MDNPLPDGSAAVDRPGRAPSPAPPLYRRDPVKIACVQFDPKLGMVAQNAAKVQTMLHNLTPGSVDLLVLPEMALSGYVFNTPASILPYLEPQRIGPTSLLCRSIAKKLRCCVIAGYPEKLPDQDEIKPEAGSRTQVESATDGISNLSVGSEAPTAGKEGVDRDIKGEALGVGYNSATVVDKNGEVVGNYRKTFRFETDKNWAREGDGFRHFDLGGPLGRVGLGICMDMNPKDFVAPWDAFELANYARNNKVDTLVVPMNWLDPPVEPPNVAPPSDPDAPSESTLNYWAARLTPLHDPTPDYTSTSESSSDGTGKEVIFVGCNRIGTEQGTTFIGTSCVMTVSSDPPRIELVDCCTVTEERVMIATVT